MHWDSIRNGYTREKPMTISADLFRSLFGKIFKLEHQDKDNKFDCDTCGLQLSTIRQLFEDHPKILIVQIQRMYNDRDGLYRLQHDVNIPTTLEYNPIPNNERGNTNYVGCKEKVHYRMFACINNDFTISDGVEHGHWYVDILNWFSGTWFRCSDNEISMLPNFTSKKDVKTKEDSSHVFYIDTEYWGETCAYVIQDHKMCIEKHKELKNKCCVPRGERNNR